VRANVACENYIVRLEVSMKSGFAYSDFLRQMEYISQWN